MSVPECVYDNPATMSRELYLDGKLVEAYSAELLVSKEPHIGDVLGAGNWNPGQLIGDVRALGDSLRAKIPATRVVVKPTEAKQVSSLNPRQMFMLDEACKPIVQAFGRYPYLVGAVVDSNDFHDVDVRLIMDDDAYDRFEKAVGRDAITLIGFAIGDYLEAKTALPIDFQFQRCEQANAKHKGRRNPLGIRDLDEYRGDARPGANENEG